MWASLAWFFGGYWESTSYSSGDEAPIRVKGGY